MVYLLFILVWLAIPVSQIDHTLLTSEFRDVIQRCHLSVDVVVEMKIYVFRQLIPTKYIDY
jgi:hypothetical protein